MTEAVLLQLFKDGFNNNTYKRVEHPYEVRIYVGANEKGHFALKLMGNFKPEKIVSSSVITVQQYVDSNKVYSLVFALEQHDLLEYFVAFCNDLITSISDVDTSSAAYREMATRYFSWKKLFRANPTKLSEKEVIGLIAELLFLRDRLFPLVGQALAIQSWSGPEKLHKDFSLNNDWYEVKAISSNKDCVRISSLSQLDSDIDGHLCVYRFEKMSPAFDGLKLNKVVTSILHSLPHGQVYELFLGKLEEAGYTWAADYDNLVYNLIDTSFYEVRGEFPRLLRATIPMAINAVQYDILLSEIEPYKTIL